MGWKSQNNPLREMEMVSVKWFISSKEKSCSDLRAMNVVDSALEVDVEL